MSDNWSYEKQAAKSRKAKLVGGGLIIFLIIIIGAKCGNHDGFDVSNSDYRHGQPLAPVAEKTTPSNDEIIAAVQTEVKNHLKAPSAASFPLENIHVVNVRDTILVIGDVDAQNSFGAKLRNTYGCTLVYIGGDWASPSSWNFLSLAIDNQLVYKRD